MEPSRGEGSDSDISDDWNVVEAKESFGLSESESIEVIGTDDLDSVVESDAAPVTEDDTERQTSGNIGRQKDVENVAQRPLVSDDETIDANESDSSCAVSSQPFARSQALQVHQQQLPPQISSSSLRHQTSTLLFISNQMFAFLMLLVAVALSFSGEGALSRLASFDSYSLTRDGFMVQDHQSQSENGQAECSRRLNQVEKKIENIRLAALSLENGSISLPVFMDFIKDIGRPAFGQVKTKSHDDEVVDFSPTKKRKFQRYEKFAGQSSSRLEDHQIINNFQRFGDSSVKKFQKFEDQRVKDTEKFKKQGTEDSQMLKDAQGSPKFKVTQDSPNSKDTQDSSKFINQITENSPSFVDPNSNEYFIHHISLILKKSDQPNFQKLGAALLNISSHLSESYEKINNFRLMPESSHSKFLNSLREKLSIVSSKVDQQLFDFFQRIASKFSKHLNKIDEQFKKIHCSENSKFNNCQRKNRKKVNDKSGIREDRRFGSNNEQQLEKLKRSEYFTEKYEIDGDTAGKVENYHELSGKDSNIANCDLKYWQKRNSNKFAKNRKRELADEFKNSDVKNFEKGEKRFKNKDDCKLGSVPVGFDKSNRQKEYSDSGKNFKKNINETPNRVKESNVSNSSGTHKSNSKHSVNDELRLKKNFVQMSFENVDKLSDNTHQESNSNIYNADTIIFNENRPKKQDGSINFEYDLTDGDRIASKHLQDVSEMFLKHEILANLKNDGTEKVNVENDNTLAKKHWDSFEENGQNSGTGSDSFVESKVDVDVSDDLLVDDEEVLTMSDENLKTDDFFVINEDGFKKGNSKRKTFENYKFDKFTQKDIAKLKKQILKTTQQNVEQMFDSFLASLMEGKLLNSTSQSELALSDWFLLLGKRRSEIRRINSQSDWLFDRAVNRRNRHHQSSVEESWGTHWLFRRALERHKCRESPHSAKCQSSATKIFSFNTRQSILRDKKFSPDR